MRFLSRFGLNQLDKDFYHFGLKMVGERYLVFRSMNFSKSRVLFAANLRRYLHDSFMYASTISLFQIDWDLFLAQNKEKGLWTKTTSFIKKSTV